jgi:16S rRNA (cytidine1402-2'-O)-methyltransferase|tara:strand:+ start:1277 stop:2119 length:843 start_codon:yes stop_codon:yes gene_type:complete
MNSFVPGLYIVSTPIGNLDDISLRAVETIKNSDIVLCEDTRRSLKLLNHLKISKKLISYHKFNEKKELSRIIQYLNEGKIVSLISDAGTPVLSDPGNILINECIKKNLKIIPIPGASAITSAMCASGFDDQFLFFGFLPKTEKEAEKIMRGLRDIKFSIIFFIPGIKVNFYLKLFKKHFLGRKLMIAREMTKIHETFYREEINKINMFKTTLKGELTVVISKKNNKTNNIDYENIKKQMQKYIKKYTIKDTVDLIFNKEKMSKKLIYKMCLDIKNNEKTN